MTTALIFAGGKSSRMGRDKAAMYGGVARLIDECSKAGISKIITLCGAKEKKICILWRSLVRPRELCRFNRKYSNGPYQGLMMKSY